MKFKKIAALCLAAAMVVSMVGCGDKGNTTKDTQAETKAAEDTKAADDTKAEDTQAAEEAD